MMNDTATTTSPAGSAGTAAAEPAEAKAQRAPAPDSASVPATASPEGLPIGPEPLTPEQLEDLKNRAAKADEHWDRLLRVTADLDNYRKRATRERHEAVRFANEALLQQLVPVLDNLEMALSAAAGTPDSAAQSLQTGIQMIQSQLKAVVAEAGLEEINAQGQPFDPKWHEAISQQESAEVPEGHVLQQLRKGYKLKERLLRPATVIVAKRPAA